MFIPVRPSWNDDSDLLGYVDLVHMVYRASDSGFVDFLVRAQKEENKDKIFMVCFDEMNLARVEHYFSQFLSLLERPTNQRELQLYDKQYSGRLYNSAEYPYRIKIGDKMCIRDSLHSMPTSGKRERLSKAMYIPTTLSAVIQRSTIRHPHHIIIRHC